MALLWQLDNILLQLAQALPVALSNSRLLANSPTAAGKLTIPTLENGIRLNPTNTSERRNINRSHLPPRLLFLPAKRATVAETTKATLCVTMYETIIHDKLVKRAEKEFV